MWLTILRALKAEQLKNAMLLDEGIQGEEHMNGRSIVLYVTFVALLFIGFVIVSSGISNVKETDLDM